MIAHHLELELFPAEHRFFDQHFVHGRNAQTGLHDFFEIFWTVREIAAAAAERARGADDHRKVQSLLNAHGVAHAARIAAARQVEADAPHRLFEQIAVFGFFDRIDFGADHLDAVAFEYAFLGEIDGEVERRLAAQSRQDCVGTFLGDDFFNDVGGNWLDVGAIGKSRIGHDRRRIGIDEDHPVTLFFQSLQSLCAGVVELASLTDDNRSGADQ